MNLCPYCGLPTRLPAADVSRQRGCCPACQQAVSRSASSVSGEQVCPFPRRPPPLIRPESMVRSANQPAAEDLEADEVRLSSLTIGLGAVGLLVFVMAGLVVAFVVGHKTHAPARVAVPEPSATAPVPQGAEDRPSSVKPGTVPAAVPLASGGQPTPVAPTKVAPTAVAVPEPDSEPPRAVFEDLDRQLREGALNLPLLARSSSQFKDLAKLLLKSPKDLKLELLAGDLILGEGYRLVLSPGAENKDGDREFSVTLAHPTAGASPAATFRLKDNVLQFQWNAVASERAANLRFCRLRIQAGEEARVCTLGEPVLVPSGSVDLTAKEFALLLPLPTAQHLDPSRISFEVNIEAKDDKTLPAGEALSAPQSMNQRQTLVVVQPSGPMGNDSLELDLRLEPTLGALKLVAKPFAYRTERSKDGTEQVVRTEIWSSRLKSLRDSNTRGVEELKGRQAKLERRRKDYEKGEKAGQATIDQLRTQQTATNTEIVAQRVSIIENQLLASANAIVKDQTAIDQETAFFETGKAWCEMVAKDLESLQSRKIHVSIYVSVGKEPADRVCLLKTRSGGTPADP